MWNGHIPALEIRTSSLLKVETAAEMICMSARTEHNQVVYDHIGEHVM